MVGSLSCLLHASTSVLPLAGTHEMFRFTDRSFPPNFRSIGRLRGMAAAQIDAQIVWVRAREHCVKPRLFEDGDIEARDVAQGYVGNCWLIAAIACVAAHEPDTLRRAFVTKRTSSRGKYRGALTSLQPTLCWCCFRALTSLRAAQIPSWQSAFLMAQPPHGKML